MSFPYYAEDLVLITAVTKMLNENKTSNEGYYVHVELREVDSHRVVGEWSDEIAPDAWSYSEKIDTEGSK